MICLHSVSQHLSVVILSLKKRLASDIILALHFWRVKFNVISPAAPDVYSPALDTLHQNVLVNLKFDSLMNRRVLRPEHFIEFLSLPGRPWKPVEEQPALTLGPLRRVLYQLDNHLIGHEFAPVDNLLRLLSELGALRVGVPQHVPRGEVAQAELVFDARRLGALAGAGRTDQNDVLPRFSRANLSSLNFGEELLKPEGSQTFHIH